MRHDLLAMSINAIIIASWGVKILQIDIFCLLLHRKSHIGNTLWLFRQFYISVVYIYI